MPVCRDLAHCQIPEKSVTPFRKRTSRACQAKRRQDLCCCCGNAAFVESQEIGNDVRVRQLARKSQTSTHIRQAAAA